MNIGLLLCKLGSRLIGSIGGWGDGVDIGEG